MEKLNSERVAKNTGFLFMRMLVLMGIGLFTSREILRILGVEDFGIYNLVGTIVIMFIFLQTALNNATSRYISFEIGTGNKESLQKTFSMSINAEIILALIIFLLSEILGVWFINNKLNIPGERLPAAQIVFQISLFNFLISLIKTPYSSLVIAHEKMNFFAYTSIIEGILKLLTVYLLTIIAYDKIVIYAFLQVVVTIIIFICFYLYCKKFFEDCSYKKYWDSSLFTKLFNYSGWSLLVNVCDIAVVQSITIFFNVFSGVTANAALAIANQVNSQLNQFLGAFSQSYSPQIVKSYAAKNYGYFMNLIYSSSKFSFFLLFGIAFPVMLNIDYLLDLWLSNPPFQTGEFLLLICIYSLLDSFSMPLWQSVHATGNLKVHQLLMGGVKILNIPISYILLKMGMPIVTVLFVYVLLNIICDIVRIWWLQYLIGLDVLDYLKNVIWPMFKIVCISVPLPWMIFYFHKDGLFCLIISTAIFLPIYFISIYYLAINSLEKDIIDSLFIKFRNMYFSH